MRATSCTVRPVLCKEPVGGNARPIVFCFEDIEAGLNLLFAYRIEAATGYARMGSSRATVLILRKSSGLDLRVEIDPQNGSFVLRDKEG